MSTTESTHEQSASAHRPMSRRPTPADHAPHYAPYIALVPAGDLIRVLDVQVGDTVSLITASAALARGDYRYAPGKWSLKQVAGHIADTERVMAYRILRFARGDATPLPGFDEATYAAAAGSDARTLDDLAAELVAVRAATTALLRGLPDEAWDRRGIANDAEASVLGIA